MTTQKVLQVTDKGATFSECGKYRYVLWRVWDESKPKAMCIGLNPSTANTEANDPTITRLIALLNNNGYGALYMTNLFALVSPYPEDLRICHDPVKDNDFHLMQTVSITSAIIFCWGSFRQADYRAKMIKKILPISFCFGQNANGSPKHPLYLKANTKLKLFI